MPALIALALSVGVLAVIDTWLFVGPLASTALGGLVWISFVAWGCFYHSGGGTKGLTTTIACMIWGALVGMASIMAFMGPLAGLGDFAAPLAVGIGAAVICLSSAIGLLSTIPASVYGFASIAGFAILGGRLQNAETAIFPVVCAVIIGAVFGIASEMLANALTKKDNAAAAQPAE